MIKGILLITMSGLTLQPNYSESCEWLYKEAYDSYYDRMSQGIPIFEARERVAKKYSSTALREGLYKMIEDLYIQEPRVYSYRSWRTGADDFATKWTEICYGDWRFK